MTETNNAARVTNRVAWTIQQRATAQGWKGKKGDGLAMECAIGALGAAIALNGDEAHETQALSFFAFMVSTRGMAYVHERAARHQPTPEAIAQIGDDHAHIRPDEA